LWIRAELWFWMQVQLYGTPAIAQSIQCLCHGLDVRGTVVKFLTKATDLSFTIFFSG
jgi:hypothetical protein